MLIKLFIVFISSLLLFNESFNLLGKLKKKNKKLVLIITLSLLFVFSMIDIFITTKEGDELVEKANTIIRKSDTLTANTRLIEADLKRNIESVKKTGKSLAQIDSVLKGVKDSVSKQVEVLKGAVEKSKELERLEKMKFQQEQANLIIYSNKVYHLEDNQDSLKYKFGYDILNRGQRNAEDLDVFCGLFYYKSSINKISNVLIRSSPHGLKPIGVPKRVELNHESFIKYEEKPSNLDILIVVIDIKYIDEISRKILTKTFYLHGEKLDEDIANFRILTESYLFKALNDKLIQMNLKKYQFNS